MITLVYFWRIKKIFLPIALLFMAINRISLKKMANIKFVKSLGTGKGESFTPRDADQYRWGLLLTATESDIEKIDNSTVIKGWQKISSDEYRVVLRNISAHGSWSKQQPFLAELFDWDGKVAAITRARIVWRKNLIFWRAVPPVTTSLHKSPGLISAIGIGEAPIGLQGTFSIWESTASLREFAYKGQAHAQAIKATHLNKWYSEELFSRFAVIQERGNLK
jgi:hypothetical protein